MSERFFGLLKASTVFLAATLLVQGITAGLLLSGEGGSSVHHATGPLVTVAMVVQLVAALLVWRVVGGSGDLAVHVPLGVALFGVSTVLVAQVWSRRVSE